MSQAYEDSEPLRGPHVIEYPFRRSCGPVLGRFFTGLRDGKLIGIRSKTAGVLVPPAEYDAQTAEELDEFVDVGPGGEVVSYSWVSKPREQQPLAHPFAYALVQLDGADTPMVQVVDAGSEEAMKTGMRVTARWSDEATGMITDLSFVPIDGEA